MSEDSHNLFIPVYPPQKVVVARAEGACVWDTDGKDYIDLGCGVAVTSLGHAAPTLRKVLEHQAAQLWHTSNLYLNEPAIRLARLLRDKTFADRVFLCNSGTEANEAAIKLVRKRGFANGKGGTILSFSGSFHGRTGFSMAATGQEKIRRGFGDLAPGFRHETFNDPITAEKAFSGGDIGGVIVEPVQGEGGVVPVQPDFLRRLRELCDAHDALLILDEVQTGIGRCGSLYCHTEFGVVPDIMTSAKGLGGGLPIGATLASEKAASALGIGDHGNTYGGNPIAAAVAATIVETVSEPEFIERVRRRAEEFRQRLADIHDRLGCFSEIRGMGLLIGCDLAFGAVADFVDAARQRGVLVLRSGENTLRLAPPLTISDKELEEGFRRLEQAATDFADNCASR